jgi:phage tail-like protein
MPLPDEPASRYLRYLPALYQESDFIGRFLLIFEAIWEPLERRQDQIAAYFDPRTCPAEFLPWLASWLEVPLEANWPEHRRRHLLAEGMHLARWRGTAYGLRRVIELATGITVDITEDRRTPFVFRIRAHIPAGSGVSRDLVEDLIQKHKPAHAGYVLEVTP